MGLIIDIATSLQLRSSLVASIVYQESKGYQYAAKREDRFYRNLIETKSRSQLSGYVPAEYQCDLITEKNFRATSWGYMQVMGETARWLGYAGISLAGLTAEATNILFGCKYLKYLIDLKKDERQAVAAYNGAKDQKLTLYDDVIYSHIETGKYVKVINI